MKKIIFASAASIMAVTSFAQFGNQEENKNALLNASYWQKNPSLDDVKAEVAKGNDPTEKNRMQFDVTYIAIQNGASLEVVKYLLEKNGGDVNKLGHEKLTYVHAAASNGNVELLNYLITKGAKLDVETDFGMTPIVMAASRGIADPAVYEAFFKAGIDPKQKYTNGANLLLLGIANDTTLKLTDYLTTKGLSLNDVDDNGATAFDYAAKKGDIKLLKTLDAKGVKHTDNALFMAAGGGGRRQTKGASLDVYKYLVEDAKVNPTATDKDGQNILHVLAAKPDQTDIINYFIAKGADVNGQDKEGTTVLMKAASNKSTDALQSILPKVKDVNTVNNGGESALTFAVKSGSVDGMKLLLSKGADVKAIDKEGNNLAYALVQSKRVRGNFGGGNAAKGGRNNGNEKGGNRGGGNTAFFGGNAADDTSDKLALLKQSGLDLAAPQQDGSTLYHLAASKNDLATLKSLSSLGINVNAKDKEGLTALHKAALVSKNDEILKYLISIGADKTVKTDMGETAYDLAKENDYLLQNNISIDFLK